MAKRARARHVALVTRELSNGWPGIDKSRWLVSGGEAYFHATGREEGEPKNVVQWTTQRRLY